MKAGANAVLGGDKPALPKSSDATSPAAPATATVTFTVNRNPLFRTRLTELLIRILEQAEGK